MVKEEVKPATCTGELIICASSRKLKGLISGHTLFMVNLVDVVPFTKKHLNGSSTMFAGLNLSLIRANCIFMMLMLLLWRYYPPSTRKKLSKNIRNTINPYLLKQEHIISKLSKGGN